MELNIGTLDESVDEFGMPLFEARTKEFKIDGASVEAVLMAGGSGFKIYSVPDGVLLVVGREKKVFKEKDPLFSSIINYVNLRYHPANRQEEIKKNFDDLIRNLSAVKESVVQSDNLLMEEAGKGAIYTLILFDGCDLHDILHHSHWATNEVDKYEEIVKACDEYFKDGVESRELSFNEPGFLGKEDQPVLHLTSGVPYKDLFDKLSGIAEYKYPKHIPHISVTSNVDGFTGMTSYLVISKNGEEVKRYKFDATDEKSVEESLDSYGIVLFD